MDFIQVLKIKRLPNELYSYCKRTYETLVNLDLGVYWFWAALRVVLTLAPQTGYIHPDEFFQTVEVFAGDAFGTEVSLPWEFNKSFPIRSIPVVYATVYVPFSLLRRASTLTDTYLGFGLINHYLLLVVPRLSMCFLSFISDVCLFKICYHFGQNYKERLVIYASSFVCLVFMTRTFTNTVEITCFNVLLCLVALCMAESEKVAYQNDFLQDKYNEAESIPDRVRITKLMKLLPKHSLNRCVAIALATVAGFFNRPTFLLFALTPLFYWFQRGLDLRSTFLKDFHLRIFLFSLYCVPVISFFVCFDSAYYGYITWGEVFSLKITADNFLVTPLNFIRYNLDPSNLAQHGLHPRFLHFLVNIPLLFNILGLSGLLVIAKLLYRGSLSHWTLLPKSQSITGMMTLSFLVPVAMLSLFPHQEPRFIAPVLLPLVFLYSHLVRDFDEDWKTVVPFRKRHPKQKEITGLFRFPLRCIDYVEKATKNFDNRYNVGGRQLASIKNREVVEAAAAAAGSGPRGPPRPRRRPRQEEDDPKTKKTDLVRLWFALNIVCVAFFGFVHQGGVYSLTRDFRTRLLVKPRFTTFHLVTSHVYSLPVHLLSLTKSYKSKNINFISYELGSEDLDKVNLKLRTILRVSEAKKKSAKRNYQLFYAFPATLLHDFDQRSRDFEYDVERIFYPHFSSEALPGLPVNATGEPRFRFSGLLALLNHFDSLPLRYLLEFSRQFGLVLVRVRLAEEAPGDKP